MTFGMMLVCEAHFQHQPTPNASHTVQLMSSPISSVFVRNTVMLKILFTSEGILHIINHEYVKRLPSAG